MSPKLQQDGFVFELLLTSKSSSLDQGTLVYAPSGLFFKEGDGSPTAAGL